MSTLHDLAAWCDKHAAEGKEVKIGWDGGGDSGWVTLYVDNVEDESDEAYELINLLEDVLDYGSWAGEYHATGEAIYNPETKQFVGTDYYGEEEWQNVKDDYVIRIPSSIKFDGIYLEADDGFVEAKLIVQNGFKTDEYEEIESSIEQYMDDYAEKVLRADNCEFEMQAYSNETIPFTDFRLSEDGTEYICDDSQGLSFRLSLEDDRTIVLNLNEDE